MVGTVNAAPNDFRTGVDDLIKAEALFPGWLGQLPDEARAAWEENRAALVGGH